ncbi:MAG: polysaccharide biosynthesis tyrosine autokinase [Gemmatimonadaceae bacterium]
MSRPPTPQTYRPFNDPVLTQIEVLQSQAVAESVAEKEGLRLRELPKNLPPMWASAVRVAPTARNDTLRVEFADSSFTLRSAGGQIRGTYGDTVELAGVRLVVPHAPGIKASELRLQSAADAANEVRGNLSARERERTDIIDVSYTAPDPALAQRVANAAVYVFQSYSAQTAKQASQLRRQFIAGQLEKTEALLADARAAHNAFRSKEKVYSSEDKFRAQQADLTSIDLRRQELQADRGTYLSILNELQHTRGSTSTEKLSALAASPGVATNTVVSQLFTQLVSLQEARDSLTAGRWGNSPNNPDVMRLDALIASAEQKVESAVRANVGVLDARIAALDSQKTTVASGMAGLPQAQATEATLFAQVTTYSRQVDRLRDDLQSAEIAEAAEVGQVEIVDLARADGVPLGTGRRPKVLLAAIFGLVLGTLIAYILENYRPVIRRRDELEAALAVPNLALVPQIRGLPRNNNAWLNVARRLPASLRGGELRTNGASRGADLVTLSDVRSSGAEAYRTLRTNLLFSAAVQAVSRIVITSPGPEEGKSTTAANLAIAFAQQGHRVLLIDCDLRRARIHRIFEETNIPGLTSVLVGGDPIASAIRTSRVPGLNILPSGPLPPNPAELLGSVQMTALLDQLSLNYDLLILDTPPLLAASDAAIVSRVVDGAIVVVRAGKTEKSALQTAVQQLATVGARVLGTVLNDPDAEVPKYARYYGYYYNSYYDYSNGTEAKA